MAASEGPGSEELSSGFHLDCSAERGLPVVVAEAATAAAASVAFVAA